MITCVIARIPPAPMPCTARHARSIGTDVDSPATSDAPMKIRIASCMRSFLLVKSASLPHSGVDAVVVSKVAVTTQV
jgi:hypothetical protein